MSTTAHPADVAVNLAGPNPWWPQIFRQETGRLCHVLHCRAEIIEHIGSTAVPGLEARPIIDIAIGAATYPPPLDVVAAIVDLGYESLGETGGPGRLQFRRRRSQSFDIEVIARDGARWRDHLLLRDYLRASPAACAQYTRARRAATMTLTAYTAAKSAALTALLETARRGSA